MANWSNAWKWAEEEVNKACVYSAYAMREKAKAVQKEETLKEALKPRIPSIIASIEQDIKKAAKQGKMKIEFITWYEDTEYWGMNYTEMLLLEPVIKKIFTNAGYICCDGGPHIDNKKRHCYSWGEIMWH